MNESHRGLGMSVGYFARRAIFCTLTMSDKDITKYFMFKSDAKTVTLTKSW